MQGIWLGMIGGTTVQAFILLFVIFRTHWNEEVNTMSIFSLLQKYKYLIESFTLQVEKAKKRLDKWEDKKE